VFDIFGDVDNWQGAKCSEAWVDPDIFFMKELEDFSQTICEKCPLIEQCAEYAVSNQIAEGVWGGLTENQRKEIWKHQRRSKSRKGIPNKKF
jgi:WhiB family redox-sensing transcriptional regulator